MRTRRTVVIFLLAILSLVVYVPAWGQTSPLICFEDSVDGSFWRVGFSPDPHGFGGIVHGEAQGNIGTNGVFHGAIVPRQNGDIAIAFSLQTLDTHTSGNWTVSYLGLLTLLPEVTAGGTRTDSSGSVRLWSWHQAPCHN